MHRVQAAYSGMSVTKHLCVFCTPSAPLARHAQDPTQRHTKPRATQTHEADRNKTLTCGGRLSASYAVSHWRYSAACAASTDTAWKRPLRLLRVTRPHATSCGSASSTAKSICGVREQKGHHACSRLSNVSSSHCVWGGRELGCCGCMSAVLETNCVQGRVSMQHGLRS